ncbi:MAG: alanine--tRNA ligase, partial [Actinobacteria bacterium]|nr:alanine--tRNA ligase [Actinomycetota bacterium]
LMERQRARARAAQKKEIISVSSLENATPTAFTGFEGLETEASVLEVVRIKDRNAVILDRSVCYAEMGGQVGDTGSLHAGGSLWRIADTQKSGPTWLHFLEGEDVPLPGAAVTVAVDPPRRTAIQRHHTVTHLLHWALREVLGDTVSQKGSFVGPDKLTFDFSSAALTPAQVSEVERLVNERVKYRSGDRLFREVNEELGAAAAKAIRQVRGPTWVCGKEITQVRGAHLLSKSHKRCGQASSAAHYYE